MYINECVFIKVRGFIKCSAEICFRVWEKRTNIGYTFFHKRVDYFNIFMDSVLTLISAILLFSVILHSIDFNIFILVPLKLFRKIHKI